MPSPLRPHALREVGVEADALPLGCREGATLVPDLVRDAERSDVVEPCGAAEGHDVSLGEAIAATRFGGELRDPARVPERPW